MLAALPRHDTVPLTEVLVKSTPYHSCNACRAARSRRLVRRATGRHTGAPSCMLAEGNLGSVCCHIMLLRSWSLL